MDVYDSKQRGKGPSRPRLNTRDPLFRDRGGVISCLVWTNYRQSEVDLALLLTINLVLLDLLEYALYQGILDFGGGGRI